MSGKYSARAARSDFIAVSAIIAALAAAPLPMSVLVSCTRRAAPPVATPSKATQGGAQSQPTPRANPRPPAQAAPPAQVGSSGAMPSVARPARMPSAPLAASIRGFGLRAKSIPRVAWDFELGPLQSYRPAEGDEAAVFSVARAFAEGIAAGKLDRNSLLPEARDALSVLLAPPPPPAEAQSATPFRLGAILLQGQGASLRLRLPGAFGAARVEGLLSLRKVGESWYVEALSLDPPTSAAVAFNPDSR